MDEINDSLCLVRKLTDYCVGKSKLITLYGQLSDRTYVTAKYGVPLEEQRFAPLFFESHTNIAQMAAFYICRYDPTTGGGVSI